MKIRGIEINFLALLGTGLLIASMFFPWWSFALEWTPRTDIYPYVIDGPGSELVGYSRSPSMSILTGVLAACILMMLAGGFLRGKAAPILLGISGLLTLTGSFLLIRRLGGVAARFHIPLHGSGTTFYEMMIIETWASLQPGLFLAVAAGLLALLACLSETRLFRGG
ncbi:MAG: hypothetical protein GX495_21255 [Chloroflexi bacterium]|nr:hypothetical protein [Chloroflexota bacterium]